MEVIRSLGALMAEVPLGVVTVTSTVPVPDGTVTVRLEAVTEEIPVPAAGAEVDGGGTGKAGSIDRHLVFVPLGPVVRDDPGDCRERVGGVLVTRRVDGRRAVGGGDGDVDRARSRRNGHGEAGGPVRR